VRAEIALALAEAGFQVTGVADGYQGLRSLYESPPNLIIMAKELPILSGEKLCSRLRQLSYLPIIVVGSEGEEPTAVILELGADAYVVVPPNAAELVARVRSLLGRRREPGHDPPTGNPGDDPTRRITRRRNGSRDLTSTELRLLRCLALNDGQVVTHPQLITEVWGGKQVSLHCLKFYVRRLRQKLEGDSLCHIVNCRGVGYRLEGEGI